MQGAAVERLTQMEDGREELASLCQGDSLSVPQELHLQKFVLVLSLSILWFTQLFTETIRAGKRRVKMIHAVWKSLCIPTVAVAASGLDT